MDQGNEVLVKVVGLGLNWFPIGTRTGLYCGSIVRKSKIYIPLPSFQQNKMAQISQI